MRRFCQLVFSSAFALGCLTAFCCASPVPAADTLTVQDVIRRTVQNHPAVQRALEDAKAADARVGQSCSALYPTLDGVFDYARIGPVPSIPFFNEVFELAPADNYDLHLGARYNVYDFNRSATQVRLSRSRAISSAEAADVVRSSLAYQATRAFYGILFLQQSIAVQDQEISALNEHHAMAQKRVQSGVSINLDVLTTEVRVAAAQSQRVDLQSQLDKQKTALRELLGLSSSAPVIVKGDFGHAPFTMNPDSLVAVAYRQRTEMQLARDAETVALMQQRLTALGDLPVLNAFATYGYKNGYEPHLHEWVRNWAVGGQLSVPIFEGKRKGFQKQEAEANLRAQQEIIRNIERQIQSETDRAIVDVKAAFSKLDISQIAIDRATAAVQVARSAYAHGTVTNVDLLDAETSLAQVNLIQLQALYACELARFGVQQAIGVKVWETP